LIKINLLAVERKSAKKKIAFQVGQKLTIGCSVILIAAGLFVGWRYWTLKQESRKLDTDIAAAQKEETRLHTIIAQVEQLEQRKSQLQQRATLIERLRKDQTGPVRMLDQISRALPPMLWLTELKQGANPNEVVMTGKCTSLTALTDFVTSLETSGYFKKSVEIVNSQTETLPTPPGQLVTFTIRGQFQRPGDAPKTAEAVAAVAKQG
jgi:type IV pilus assembly protein PilN